MPQMGPTAASLATLTDSCSGLGELARTGMTSLRLPRVGPDVSRPAMTHWGSGIEGMESSTGRVQCGLGDAVVRWGCLTASPGCAQPGSQGTTVGILGSPVSLSLSRGEDKQSGVQRQSCQESAPPSCFSLCTTLSGCEFVLYADHLEALKVITITSVCLGLLNWIYWGVLFFASLKDPLMGPNQFRTAIVTLARLTRRGLSPGLSASAWWSAWRRQGLRDLAQPGP